MPARGAIRVAVVGATGYTGAELLRYLARHPHVALTAATSEQSAGKAIAEVYPSLRGKVDLPLFAFDAQRVADAADIAFVGLPHGAAANAVASLVGRGVRVVDLSADFRFRDADEYARVYQTHPAPHLLVEAVYGLSEYARGALAAARVVAVPGCYPTGALLGLLPLLADRLVEPAGIVVDSKSGVTGAGRTVAAEYLFAEVDDNLRAYKIGTHRHAPEIEQGLRMYADVSDPVLFVPHLLPIRRGILSTIHLRVRDGVDGVALARSFQARYANERFIVLSPDRSPEIRDVVGTNDCAIGWTVDRRTGRAVVVTVIDNLGKGAAGQAIQDFNVMMGLPEPTGIDQLALVP